MDLKKHIRHIQDFPKPGILFYDITTLLGDSKGFSEALDMLSEPFVGKGIDSVIGIESRGFIFGSAVADRIGAGFVPIRKPGKLPSESIKETYELEYGQDSLEIHKDAVVSGQKVLILMVVQFGTWIKFQLMIMRQKIYVQPLRAENGGIQ